MVMYICPKCGARTLIHIRVGDAEEICPKCGEKMEIEDSQQ